jgi:hypothetical protein
MGCCIGNGTGCFSGEQLANLQGRGIDARVKTQPSSARYGKFSKDEFGIDLDDDTVSCPAGRAVPIIRGDDGSGTALRSPVRRLSPA